MEKLLVEQIELTFLSDIQQISKELFNHNTLVIVYSCG